MENREELIKELQSKTFIQDDWDSIEECAEFICAYCKRIVQPLIDIPNIDRIPADEWIAFARDGINATLKRAGLEK